MADFLHALAPAKVNLSLRITGHRPDGYHLLDSLVGFTDFGDTLTFEPSDRFRLTVDGPFADGVPTDDSNLVSGAAAALASAAGIAPHGHIHLTKNLPAAAGIGGGSSDAAAALRLLTQAWNTTITTSDLASVALALGADVPVCLTAAACRMQGIGEKLTPLPPLPPLGIVLVNPGERCPTAAVFRARTGGYSVPSPDVADAYTADTLIASLAHERNDLTEAAFEVCPSIADVLRALAQVEGILLARMSGSGATCFGLFTDTATAKAAATALAHTGWWVRNGILLP